MTPTYELLALLTGTAGNISDDRRHAIGHRCDGAEENDQVEVLHAESLDGPVGDAPISSARRCVQCAVR